MFWILGALALALVIALVLLEVRVRRPDELVLFETDDGVRRRAGRIYLKRFAVSIRATTHTFPVRVAAEAAGHLGVDVQLSLTVAPSVDHLSALVRAGGWQTAAVEKAARELEASVHSVVGGFVEPRGVEELPRETLAQALGEGLSGSATALGLELLAVNVLSVAPSDGEIAEAIRRQEAARVLERSQAAEEAARVASAKARHAADEAIADAEHALAMKRLALRETEEGREAVIARRRLEEDNARRQLELEVDRQEVELLRGSPELLMLTPQVARLAEASQNLRNARTVVSLAGGEGGDAAPVLKTLLSLVARATGVERAAGAEARPDDVSDTSGER